MEKQHKLSLNYDQIHLNKSSVVHLGFTACWFNHKGSLMSYCRSLLDRDSWSDFIPLCQTANLFNRKGLALSLFLNISMYVCLLITATFCSPVSHCQNLVLFTMDSSDFIPLFQTASLNLVTRVLHAICS